MNKIKLFITIFTAFLFLGVSGNLFAQWTFLPGGSITNPGPNPSISAVDQNTYWVAGGQNTPSIWRSTNAGSSVTNVTGSGISLDLFCVWGKDANNAYVGDGGSAGGAGGNAKVYQTTNGGTTWTTILSTGGAFGFINGIVFSRINPQIGVIESDPPNNAGQPYWVQLTTNGGTTWTLMNPPGISGAASAQNSVVCIDQSFFGFGLNAGASRVDVTTNGGTSWTAQSLNLTGSFIAAFAFANDKLTGVACTNTSLPSIARTINGGSTWSSVNVGAGVTAYCSMKWVPGTNTVYLLGGTGSPVGRKSTDGGATWTNMTTGGITGFTHMDLVVVGGTVYGFAVASDGSVCKMSEPVVGINNGNSNIPREYRLEQNYPNPFNPTTNINYSLPRASDVSLKVYDMLGHEVMTLVNEHKEAGSYTANVDASRLSSGVYFYTISAGDFKESKKMTLVK